jgi:DNA-binding protein HU-beta
VPKSQPKLRRAPRPGPENPWKPPFWRAVGPAMTPGKCEKQHKSERSEGKLADNELIELSESGQCEQIEISYREIVMPPVKKPTAKKTAAPAKKAAAPAKRAAPVVAPAKKSAAAPAKKAAAKKAAPPAKKAAAKAAPQVTITLKQIAASLAEGHDLPKKQAETLLGDLVALTTSHLKKGDKIRLTGLGILQVRNRAARTGRNPATGETIQIKASKKIAFRPAKELKDAV